MDYQYIHPDGPQYQINFQHRGCNCTYRLVAQGFWNFYLPDGYSCIKTDDLVISNVGL